MEQPFLSVQEVADLMGLTKNRVYQLIANRELPSARVGGAIRIPTNAWNRWIAQKSEEALNDVAATGR